MLIQSNPPDGKNTKSAVKPGIFREIKTREAERLQKAIDAAHEVLVGKKTQAGMLATNPVYKDLDDAKVLVTMAAGMFLKHPSLFEKKERGRYKWEIYLDAVRFLARQSRQSYVTKILFPRLGLEEISNYLVALAGRYLEVTNDIHRCSKQIEEYILNYNWACDVTEAVNKKETRLCQRYATLKTWQREEELNDFSALMEKAALGAFEIFIEGPLKIYLLLGPDKILLIIRAFTAENPADLLKMDPHLADALSLFEKARDTVEKASLAAIGREFIPEIIRQYVILWKKGHEEIRKELPTQNLRRMFVERFESGTLFRE